MVIRENTEKILLNIDTQIDKMNTQMKTMNRELKKLVKEKKEAQDHLNLINSKLLHLKTIGR